MNNVLFGVIRDYGWPQLRVYANSIQRTGMTARKIMFYDNVTQEALDKLDHLGFTLIHKDMPNTFPHFNWRSRQIPVVEWLQANHVQVDLVLWSGVRDHIFQTDPFAWLERYLGANIHRAVCAGEGWLIKKEPANMGFLRTTVAPYDWPWLQEHEVLCSDTLAGSAKVVLNVLSFVSETVCYSDKAADQGAFNYFLYGPYKDKLMVPALKEAFTATWYPEKTTADPAKMIQGYGAPVFNVRDGIVYTPDGVPFSMVHQYDRCPTWRDLMEVKYENV